MSNVKGRAFDHLEKFTDAMSEVDCCTIFIKAFQNILKWHRKIVSANPLVCNLSKNARNFLLDNALYVW